MATAAEVQVVRAVAAVAVWRRRPIVAAADIAETAIAVVAITRSRIPDGLICAELTREVYTFIGAVVSVVEV